MVRWLVFEKGTKSKSFVDLAWRAQQTSVLCLVDIRATRREIAQSQAGRCLQAPGKSTRSASGQKADEEALIPPAPGEPSLAPAAVQGQWHAQLACNPPRDALPRQFYKSPHCHSTLLSNELPCRSAHTPWPERESGTPSAPCLLLQPVAHGTETARESRWALLFPSTNV